jgi:hypothetical protein
MAPSPTAARNEMRGRVERTGNGGLRLTVQVEVTPAGRVRVNGAGHPLTDGSMSDPMRPSRMDSVKPAAPRAIGPGPLAGH